MAKKDNNVSPIQNAEHVEVALLPICPEIIWGADETTIEGDFIDALTGLTRTQIIHRLARQQWADYCERPEAETRKRSRDKQAGYECISLNRMEDDGYTAISAEDVADIVCAKELLEALAEALYKLTDEERTVYIRNKLRGESLRSIASDLGVGRTQLTHKANKTALAIAQELEKYR